MEWISVKDRMPEEGERVIIRAFFGFEWERKPLKVTQIGWWESYAHSPMWFMGCGSCGCAYDMKVIEPTHWMPLPAFPEEKEEE